VMSRASKIGEPVRFWRTEFRLAQFVN